MEENSVKTDLRDDIMLHLEDIERDLAWLSRKTDINYATLYSIFKQKTFNPTQEKLDLINGVLETSFTLPEAKS